jgi:hypothetical protein
MMALITRLGVRTSGIILLTIAGVTTAAGVGLIVTSIWRWQAVVSLESYHLSLFARDAHQASQAANEAAQAMPGFATALLPALDLSSTDGEQRIARLIPRSPAAQRRVLEAGDGLAQVLLGKAPPDLPGDDGQLLGYLATLPKNGPSSAPALTSDAAPQRGILSLVYIRRFQAAWAEGAAETVRAASGPLLMLDPKQPDAGRLRCLLYASDPATPSARLRSVLSEAITDRLARTLFIRQLYRLWPARMADLLAEVPTEALTADERLYSAVTSSGGLDDQVRNAISHPDQGTIGALLPRVLAIGRLDWAHTLISLLPPERRPEYDLAVATLAGDLDAVITIGGDRPDLHPHITAPVVAQGHMAFHLATSSGFIPRGHVVVRIDGKPLSDDKVQHWASLVNADIGTAAGLPYEVRLGDRVVANGQLP